MDIMYGVLLFLHVLGATIWTGGHIVLSVAVLPGVLRDGSPERLLRFESGYEKVGMPALAVQVITGIWLAHRMLPDFGKWLDLSNPVSHVLVLKFVLLALTLAIAINARLRVIPRLGEENLKVMAWHIAAVTLLAILFVFAGVSFRTGWLY
jgi:putative copper export protein